MLPNNTIIFKQYGDARNFDDHDVRLHHHVQRDASLTPKESKHFLSVGEEVGR
jgi:hypothetical protein